MSAGFAAGMYTTSAPAESVAGDWRLAGWTPRLLRVGDVEKDARREALVALGRAMNFPDHYGVNLDALTDCLRDLTDPTVLIWADGATFADKHPKAWQAISDVLAERVKGEPPFAFVLCEPKGKGRRR